MYLESIFNNNNNIYFKTCGANYFPVQILSVSLQIIFEQKNSLFFMPIISVLWSQRKGYVYIGFN